MSQPPSVGNPYGAVPGASYGTPPPSRPQPSPYVHPQPSPYLQPGAYGQHSCRICGGFPAADVTFRSHQGLLVFMTFRKVAGPFCRTCGTAVFREQTTKTLWQGWWTPFSLALFNPGTIIFNLVVRSKINKLPDPGPDQFGARPDPGKPVLRRPASLVLLLPVLWVLFVIAAIAAG